MNDTQLLRYSRQILLADIGITGQRKLLDAKVLIMGMGGLGSPVALYLAAAGVGHLTLVDFDTVEISNLQRQIIHSSDSLRMAKVDSAKQAVNKLNPEITIGTVNKKLDRYALSTQIQSHDVIIDCSDNFDTRFQVNDACVRYKKPLVSGAVIRMEGQITTFDFNQPDSSCYRCLYDVEGETNDSCSANGILSPVAGIIGSMQATEALKIILGLPTLSGRLLLLDAKQMDWRTIKLKRDPQCAACHP